MKDLLLRTLASQLVLEDGRVVCAALATGSHGASEGQPLATSALDQHVPRMPPVDHAKRLFLGFEIPPDNFDDLRFLGRFVASPGELDVLHTSLPSFDPWYCATFFQTCSAKR